MEIVTALIEVEDPIFIIKQACYMKGSTYVDYLILKTHQDFQYGNSISLDFEALGAFNEYEINKEIEKEFVPALDKYYEGEFNEKTHIDFVQQWLDKGLIQIK